MLKKRTKQSKIQDKIQQNFLKKYLIGAGVLIFLIVFWFFFYFKPMQQQIDKYTRDVNQWMLKIKMASVSKDAILKLERNIDSLKVQIGEIESRIFHLDQMQEVADNLIRYARDHHLRVQTMVPNYDVLFPVEDNGENPLVKVPLEMRMTGRFISVGRFLEDVDQLPFIYSPDEVFLEADARIYPRLQVRVKGYLFLLSEEKKGESKEKFKNR